MEGYSIAAYETSRGDIEEKVCSFLEDSEYVYSRGDKNIEGLDSLDSVEMIMGLEDVFDMEISDGDAAKIGAVKDLDIMSQSPDFSIPVSKVVDYIVCKGKL